MVTPQNKGNLMETMEESQNKIQRTQKVRCKRGKSVDMRKYALCSGYITLQGAFNNKKLHKLGYPTFTELYLKISEN